MPVPPVPTPMPSPAVQQGRRACTDLLRQTLLDAVRPAAAPPAGPLAAELAVFTRPELPATPATPATPAAPATLLLIDRNFAAWPLDEPQLLQGLADWLRLPGRRLCIVALDFDALARSHPRFARWRRDWAHRIEALCPADGALPPGLRLLAAGPVLLQWLDAPDWRLRCVTNVVHVQSLRDQCADFLQRCEPAWPATTLGL